MRIVLIILCALPGLFAQSLRQNVNAGNDAYRQEEYEEALNYYQNAYWMIHKVILYILTKAMPIIKWRSMKKHLNHFRNL